MTRRWCPLWTATNLHGTYAPFGGLPFTTVGASYQQALQDYIVEDLNGVITAAEYPEGGEGRITQI